MEPITGLALDRLADMADEEYLAEQAERIKRHVRNLNGEISSLLLQRDQAEAKVAAIAGQLKDAIVRKERIQKGDWGAIPAKALSEPKPPYDARIKADPSV